MLMPSSSAPFWRQLRYLLRCLMRCSTCALIASISVWHLHFVKLLCIFTGMENSASGPGSREYRFARITYER